jgi:hypothetical protein
LDQGWCIERGSEGEAVLQHALENKVLCPVGPMTESQGRATAIMIGRDAVSVVKVTLVPARANWGDNGRLNGGSKIGENRFDAGSRRGRDHEEALTEGFVAAATCIV